MTKAIVGTWGKSLAVRIPADVARLTGIVDGEEVEIEEIDGAIVIRRDEARSARQQQALAAAEAIMKMAKGHRLDGLSIRELINEGRPGC